MSGFSAYTRAARWLFGTLTTVPIAGVVGVYEDAAPEGATDSDDIWIEFEAQAPGSDLSEVGEQRIWTEFAFSVRAIARGRDSIALEAIADEIDNRLHRASGTVSGGQIISSVRMQEDPASWLQQGVEYRALGGIYNLIVQPS